MTPSSKAKEYGTATLKEVAIFHGTSVQNMAYHFDNNPDKFNDLCWQWAKQKSPFAEHLRKAFIDGCMKAGINETNANMMAKANGYK